MPRTISKRFTAGHIKRLRPGSIPLDYRDSHVRGLCLTVMPAGRRVWSIRYQHTGKHKRLTLGEFPAVTLAEARRLAEDARTAIRAGHDPHAERTAVKAPTDTVAALVEAYIKHIAANKSAQEVERILRADVLPHWADRAVTSIGRRDVRELVERVVTRGAKVAANRLLAIVRRLLFFAMDRDWIQANPASRLDAPGGRERSRERVLTDDELRALWPLLSRFPATAEKQAPGRRRARVDANGDPLCPISPALADLTRLRLLTGARGGELVTMRWSDVDLTSKWWVVPPEHSKNNLAHRVPLVDDAVTIIKAHRRDDGEVDDLVFRGSGDSLRDRLKKSGSALSKALGFSFRAHDLRRTVATRLGGLGIHHEDIAAVLNHVQAGPAATRIYARYQRDSEKWAALATWNVELKRILADTPKASASILPIRRRRRAR